LIPLTTHNFLFEEIQQALFTVDTVFLSLYSSVCTRATRRYPLHALCFFARRDLVHLCCF